MGNYLQHVYALFEKQHEGGSKCRLLRIKDTSPELGIYAIE